MSRAALWLIACAAVVTIAIVFGPVVVEWIESRRDALIEKEADRQMAPVKAYWREVELFRQQARTPQPDPSLIPRAHYLLGRGFPRAGALPPEILDWGSSAEAKHYANLYLGRIALRQGNVTASRKYLLLAGDNSGSPALSDYGPDMTLADELLQRGETGVVLRYFQECQHFWLNTQKNQLERWTRDVRAGIRPDFGRKSGLSALR